MGRMFCRFRAQGLGYRVRNSGEDILQVEFGIVDNTFESARLSSLTLKESVPALRVFRIISKKAIQVSSGSYQTLSSSSPSSFHTAGCADHPRALGVALL
jgi:hypothetical protein